MKLDNYHDTYPFSFGGKYRLYNQYPTLSKKEIDQKLSHSEVYSKFKEKKKIKTSAVYVYYKRQLMQADLVFFNEPEQIASNDGYRYLLVIIDCFTKMVWMYKLKNKQCSGVASAFRNLFEIECAGSLPHNIQTDQGLEFKCKELSELFKSKNVNHYFAFSERKCVIVERVQGTLQRLFYQLMEHHNTHEWTRFIDDVKKIYISRIHRTIGMAPEKAELEKNRLKVLKALQSHYATYRNKPAKFKVGDTVRISGMRNKFKRGYHASFTDEVFKVHKVLKNLPTPRYILMEWDGEIIQNGTFWPNELTPFNPLPNQAWKVEKVIRRKKGSLLVKWRGWPEKYNSWVSEKDVENI